MMWAEKKYIICVEWMEAIKSPLGKSIIVQSGAVVSAGNPQKNNNILRVETDVYFFFMVVTKIGYKNSWLIDPYKIIQTLWIKHRIINYNSDDILMSDRIYSYYTNLPQKMATSKAYAHCKPH